MRGMATDISIAGCTHGTDDIVDVTSMQFDLVTKRWWVRTQENLRAPNRFPWVTVMGMGSGRTMEEAMEKAVENHKQKREQIKKENNLT